MSDVEEREDASARRGPEYPAGAVQAVSSGAMGLLAILVAFVAYADFRITPGSASTWADVLPICLALCAVVSLALVPLLATRPQVPDMPIRESALKAARLAFAIGAACAVVAILSFVARHVVLNHA